MIRAKDFAIVGKIRIFAVQNEMTAELREEAGTMAGPLTVRNFNKVFS